LHGFRIHRCWAPPRRKEWRPRRYGSSETPARLTVEIYKKNEFIYESTALRLVTLWFSVIPYIHMYKGLFSFFLSLYHGRLDGVKENILLRLDCLEVLWNVRWRFIIWYAVCNVQCWVCTTARLSQLKCQYNASNKHTFINSKITML